MASRCALSVSTRSIVPSAACHTSPRDYGFSSGGLAVLRRIAFELEALMGSTARTAAALVKRTPG
jgi:hypothetical protein